MPKTAKKAVVRERLKNALKRPPAKAENRMKPKRREEKRTRVLFLL